MTNATINTIATVFTNEEKATMITELNTSTTSRILSEVILRNFNIKPLAALTMAAILIKAAKSADENESFEQLVEESIDDSVIQTGFGAQGLSVYEANKQALEVLFAKMQEKGLVNEEGFSDEVFALLIQQKNALAPVEYTNAITRVFRETKKNNNTSALLTESLQALEATPFTVDEKMVALIKAAQEVLTANGIKDDEEYVLKGCEAMSASNVYKSEYFADTRGRMYQAYCHGPNGQSSDRSRALMDLANVAIPQFSKKAAIMKAIKAEMADMASFTKEDYIKAISQPVEFLVEHVTLGDDSHIKKPYSFVKAALTLQAVFKAQSQEDMPYIGMAFGLDAKCSGPQYAALMAGDVKMAARCGFQSQELGENEADAYENAINMLVERGQIAAGSLKRGQIKKAFMGIFYGQGFKAFTKSEGDFEPEYEAIYAAINANGKSELENAQEFHATMEDSFGAKVKQLRKAIKEMGHIEGAKLTHLMADGYKVEMNYRVQEDSMGGFVGKKWDDEVGMMVEYKAHDVVINTAGEAIKFIEYKHNTKTVDTYNFKRNAFVNMIQGTDALVARLIVTHLARQGVQHIVGIHDCFRTDINSFVDGELHKAIKNAYLNLFTNEEVENEVALENKDILAGFKAGLQGITESPVTIRTQFYKGDFRVKKVNGQELATLINNIAKDEDDKAGTYYFAK